MTIPQRIRNRLGTLPHTRVGLGRTRVPVRIGKAWPALPGGAGRRKRLGGRLPEWIHAPKTGLYDSARQVLRVQHVGATVQTCRDDRCLPKGQALIPVQSLGALPDLG